jgi:hypothetical protein
MTHKGLATASFVLLLFVACRNGEDTAASLQSGAAEDEQRRLGVTVETQALNFELPSAWELLEPSSSKRIAQASIPGEAGSGELAVFHFGAGQGGSVEANIDRWIEQMELRSGESPQRDVFQVGNFTVTWVDAAGTLKASSMGMGPASAQENYRLLGAVVEGPNGPWFFKATGPQQTLGSERPAFLAMLRTVRARSK